MPCLPPCPLSVSLITWRIFKVVSILFLFFFHTQETLVSFCFPLLVLSNSYFFLHISYGNLHCAFVYFTKKKKYIVHKEKKNLYLTLHIFSISLLRTFYLLLFLLLFFAFLFNVC